MAPSDNNGPSENEDFDVTLDKVTKKDEKESKKGAVSVAETAEPESVVEPTEPKIDNEPEVPATYEEVEASSEADAGESTEPVKNTAPEAEKPQQPSDKPSGGVSGVRLLFEAVLILLVIILGLWAWTLYTDRNNLKAQVVKLNANPQIAVQKQSEILIDKVGALIDLPKNETPTIASVSDATAAKKQSAFFNNAQNGDKVLMYVKAGEAILYRPSTNKIILVAPLTFNNNAASATSSSSTKATTTTPKTTSTKPTTTN